MLNLVTDRTQDDVNQAKRLAAKGWSGMNDLEKAEWSSGLKGTYNYSDLNRVENAVRELSLALGVSVTTKTDWKPSDVPRLSDMERYLKNLNVLKEKKPEMSSVILPDSMDGLTWQAANNIEKFLLDVEAFLESRYYAGELFCGEA